MANESKDFRVRRSLLTGMGVAAAGMAAGGAAKAADFSPARQAADAWMGENAAKHRVWIDTSYGTGGMEALHYSNNILTAYGAVDGGSDADYSIVICWRHYATPLGYRDPVWVRYGEIFSAAMGLKDVQTGKAFTINPANIPGREELDNGGDTIDKMRGRGVQFALCNAATRFYASYIAGEVGGDAGKIYQELVDAAIPNSRFVHAGVFATTRAQQYGYSLLYAG